MRPWQRCGYCKVILRISSDQDGDQEKSGSLGAKRGPHAVLASPLGTDPELEAHRISCEDCRAFTDGVLTLEHRLVRALKESTSL
jgi:hypothetical protein